MQKNCAIALDPHIYEVGRSRAFDLTQFDLGRSEEVKGLDHLLIFGVLFGMVFLVWYQRWFLTMKQYDAAASGHRAYLMPIIVAFVASLSPLFYQHFFNGFNDNISAIMTGLITQTVFLVGYAYWLYQQRTRTIYPTPCGKSGPYECTVKCSYATSCPAYKPLFIQFRGMLSLLLLFGVTGLIAYWIQGSQEPFSLSEGISIWPTEILRACAGLLSVTLLVRGWMLIQASTPLIEQEFNDALQKRDSGCDPNTISSVWKTYNDNGKPWHRFSRIAPLWLLYVILCILVIKLDPPFVPFRGADTFTHDHWIIFSAVLAYTFLIFAIIDSTMICRRFIHRLIRMDTTWPFMTEMYPVNRTDAQQAELNCRREWSEIHLIAARTENISHFVYYPVLAALLLIASRSSYFDNWQLPVGLALVIAGSVLLVVCCAILLRRSANLARETALQKVDNEKEKLVANGVAMDAAEIRRIEYYRERIVGIRQGVFLPITEQPWLRAVTLLFGGGGSLLLLEYSSMMH